MEADEYQPVQGAEAEPLGRDAPEDNDLLTEHQVLGFNTRPRSEQPDQQRLQQFASVSHRAPGSPDGPPLANRGTFAIGTVVRLKASVFDNGG